MVVFVPDCSSDTNGRAVVGIIIFYVHNHALRYGSINLISDSYPCNDSESDFHTYDGSHHNQCHAMQ